MALFESINKKLRCFCALFAIDRARAVPGGDGEECAHDGRVESFPTFAESETHSPS